MKSYRIKKHKMANVKINVIVQPEEEAIVIPPGGKFDAPILPSLPKPKLPRKFFTKIKKPTYTGRIEFTFEGRI